ncbi:hypothetical protein [Thalassovita mangrovi]|uniref:Uncharacterized protein n=1 Tax=Thalassovita mangrovi TaxID=2692236 RepID=A0A6L8LKD0_9RHOB|nr:hypothetical protein [Thalassovita mangrovi]MYM56521.1 hypothetical protein [Thalassovita mangrovi]
MRFAPILLLFLAACGRPLTEGEKSFAATLYGDELQTEKVRLVDGHFARSFTFEYAARPRVTCQDRVFPPVETETVTWSPAATTLFNTVLLRDDLYREDFTQEYRPGTDLYALMLFSHEMAHVWQWQNRRDTGYHPVKAAQEHGGGRDPYLFDLDGEARFADFAYEQQAAIVEEYVCCRALAPQAARTGRLHAMLSQAMPVERMQNRIDAIAAVPWKGVDTRGICD